MGLFRNKHEKIQEQQMEQQMSMQEKQHYDMLTDNNPEGPIPFERLSSNADLTKWQQDLKPFIEEMVHDLKKEYKDEDGNWKQIPGMEPLISDKMIYNMVTLLKSNTNPNTIMTKFTDSQINRHIMALEVTVVCDLAIQEAQEFNLPLCNLSQAKKIFRSYAKASLFRALGGGERLHMGTIRTVKELHSEGVPQQQEKKKGFFGM